MSLDLITTSDEPNPPEFIRGSTLEFVMEMPYTFAAGTWTGGGASSSLEAKLRLKGQAGDDGLIADLRPAFDGVDDTKVRFLAKTYNPDTDAWDVADTSNWPLGPAEFDLLISRTEAGVTKKYRSLPVSITIVDGVS